jgi:phosphotriesterase-related protein
MAPAFASAEAEKHRIEGVVLGANMNDQGKLITVTGPLAADRMGLTLTHEHLLISALAYFKPVEEPGFSSGAYERITLENAAVVRQLPFYNRENLVQADWRLAANEIRRFKLAGGRTVIDSTSVGLGRDVWALRKIAEDVGIAVVAGSGFYIGDAPLLDVPSRTVSSMRDEIAKDINEGVEDTGIRAGIIGEIGTSESVTDTEWNVLRAAAQAHHETGAAVQIHCTHRPGVMDAILDVVLDQEEVHPSRVIACHVDLLPDDVDYAKRLADRGVYLAYDCWGHPVPAGGIRVSDEQRLAGAEKLVAAGYAGQLLFSHDIGLPSRFAAYGGPGYDHLVNVVAPALLARGVSRATLAEIMIQNPRRAFVLSRDATTAAGRASAT